MNRSYPPITKLAMALVWTLLALTTPVTALGQDDCGDGLPLLSPLELEVVFEASPVRGNSLSWLPQPTDSTTCYALTGTEALTEYDVTVEGSYLSNFDRDFDFVVLDRGVVGDPTVERLELSWESRNLVEGFVSGVLNLSNSGGVYNLDLATGISRQSNRGIPSYLSRTNIRSMSVWKEPGGVSKIFAVIPGLPLVASSDGGESWFETVTSEDDPLLQRLNSPNVTRSLVAVSPDDSNQVFVGTTDGLFRSVDGGMSFEQVATDLSAGEQRVELIEFEEVTGRLFLCVTGLGFFESTDDGDSWVEFSTLRVPKASADSPDSAQTALPVVIDVVASPEDNNLIYVGLRLWGVYATTDGGLSWERRDSGMVLGPTEEFERGRKVDARTLVIDSTNSNRILAGSSSSGLFISLDAGLSWDDSVAFIPPDPDGNTLPLQKILQSETNTSAFYCATNSDGILYSTDGGIVWTDWYQDAVRPPLTRDVGDIVWHPTEPDQILMASEGGGVYQRNTALRLTDTIDANSTDEALLNLEIGLSVSFDVSATADSNGLMRPGDTFAIRSQSFQGYAVWRSQDDNPNTGEPLWDLVGLYDLTNPEFCFETPCDATNPLAIQGCFGDKRANCFDFTSPSGRIGFFDRDIYDGFNYRYAISSFDYGFTGNIAPTALARDMQFSPRSALESSDQAQNHIRPGNYNETSFTVSGDVAEDLSNIWVVPNPLRRDAGWDARGESTIHFVNVTTGSKAEVYTLAGDLVVELTNYQEQDTDRGVIVWDTRNGKGELVTSDVYIWRITNTVGEERLGKLTIIR